MNIPEDDFFENFTHSVAVARVLLTKAHEQGNLIEGLVLYASSIDAFLRNLIALKTGSKKGHTISLNPSYFFHNDSQWMDERTIYSQALQSGVIGRSLYDKLENLYAFRNKVIHRFIISNITYSEIAAHLIEYEIIYNNLYSQLEKIEKPHKLNKGEQEEVRQKIQKKIGT